MRRLLLASVVALSACSDDSVPPSPHPSLSPATAESPASAAGPTPLSADVDLRQQQLARDLGSEDATQRSAAEAGLAAIGASAAPRVLAQVRSGDLRAIAAAPTTLAQMGADVVPHLRQALQDGDANVRVVAAWALYELREKGIAAAPALRAALHDPDPKVRILADRALQAVTNDESEISAARRRHEQAEALSRSASSR